VTVGASPGVPALDPQTGRVFVGADHRLSVLDAHSGAVLHTARVDDTPSNLVVDERTRHLFVISAGPKNKLGQSIGAGHVTLLDGRTGAIVLTIRVGRAPGPAAVDTRTERVFVANQGDGTVSVLNATDCPRSPADLAPPAAGAHVFPETRHNLITGWHDTCYVCSGLVFHQCTIRETGRKHQCFTSY
jgi:DNA-binding beta-propeller fold protein YncE